MEIAISLTSIVLPQIELKKQTAFNDTVAKVTSMMMTLDVPDRSLNIGLLKGNRDSVPPSTTKYLLSMFLNVGNCIYIHVPQR